MTTSHNQLPQTSAELSAEEKNIFTLAKLEEWRAAQHAQLHDIKFGPGSFNMAWQSDFSDAIEPSLDAYLDHNGVTSDAPNYAEIRQLFRDASIDNISEDEWGNSPASRGVDQNDTKTQSDKFKEKIEARIGTETDADADSADDTAPDSPDENEEARNPDFEKLEKEVELARELWAEASAKRQGKILSLNSKKRDALRDDYFAKVQALGRRHMAEHTDYDNETKNIIATAILFDEQEKLRNSTTEKLQGTKISKIIKWMNRGNKATRIGKGLLVGAGAGLAGSFLAGAAGAGIVAGGVVVATRFARGFALADKDKRGMDLYVENEDGIYDGVDHRDYTVEHDTSAMSDDDRMDAFIERTADGFEEDTKKEQGKRRKAALVGTALIATGAVAAEFAHDAIERASGWNLQVYPFDSGDKVGDLPNTFPEDTPPTPDVDTDELPDDDTTVEDDVDTETTWADFDRSARFVVPNEGGFQTLQELGVPQDKWEAVWETAGEKFHEEGKTYHMDDGRYGWSDDMRLSDNDLEVFLEAAAEHDVKLG